MPTYDYRCKACKHEFEQFQSMSAKSLTRCPECGKNTLERLIGSGAAVVFKGSGFYQTDYRSESYKKAAEADSKAATGGEKKADAAPSGKGEKPAEATSAKTPESSGEKKTETSSGPAVSSRTSLRVSAKGTPGKKRRSSGRK